MPEFRGVPAHEIARSLRDALDLLRAYSPGPEVDAFCDYVQAETRPDTLEAKKTDAELARYMAEHVSNPFSMVGDLILYHARFDTDGKGRDIYKRLSRWGGLGGARMTAHTPMDDEQDRYILTRYLETAMAHQGGALPADNLVMLDPAQGRGDEDDVYAVLDDVIGHIAAGDEQKARAGIGRLDLNQRHRVRRFMERAFDAELGNMRPESHSPFDRYGIVIDGDLRDFHGTAQAERLMDTFHKVALPLQKSGDMQERVALGIIADYGRDNPRSKSGITFIATQKGARQIAKAFARRKIVNSRGKRVEPGIRVDGPRKYRKRHQKKSRRPKQG